MHPQLVKWRAFLRNQNLHKKKQRRKLGACKIIQFGGPFRYHFDNSRIMVWDPLTIMISNGSAMKSRGCVGAEISYQIMSAQFSANYICSLYCYSNLAAWSLMIVNKLELNLMDRKETIRVYDLICECKTFMTFWCKYSYLVN